MYNLRVHPECLTFFLFCFVLKYVCFSGWVCHGGKKRVVGTWKLWVGWLLQLNIGAGNQTWILDKSSKSSQLLGHLSTSLLLTSSFSYLVFYLPASFHYISEPSPPPPYDTLKIPGHVSKSTFSVSWLSLNLREQLPCSSIALDLLNNCFPLFYCKFSIKLQTPLNLYPTNWYSSEHVHQKTNNRCFHLYSVLDFHLDSFSL